MIRQIVLIVLLLVVAGAAIYDFKVARPAAVRANEIIEKADREDPAGTLTNIQIQKLLGRKPSKQIDGTNTYVEKYTWMSGLLFKSYYVWVVYSPKEPHVFHVHYLNTDIDKELKPDYVPPKVVSTPTPGNPASVGSAGGAGPASGTQKAGQ